MKHDKEMHILIIPLLKDEPMVIFVYFLLFPTFVKILNSISELHEKPA